MDDAIARIRPYDLQRLERARQRREDAAQSDLLIKRTIEREQEQVLADARLSQMSAIQQRIDKQTQIYASIAEKPITVGQLLQLRNVLDQLDESVSRSKEAVNSAAETHVKSIDHTNKAKNHFNKSSHQRRIVSDLRTRLSSVLIKTEEFNLETEMDDGTVDRFVTTNEIF